MKCLISLEEIAENDLIIITEQQGDNSYNYPYSKRYLKCWIETCEKNNNPVINPMTRTKLNLNIYDLMTDLELLEQIKFDGLRIKYITNPNLILCLEAVKQNGYSLRYIENQTPEICTEAVKQNPYSLKFVKDQTPEICWNAIYLNLNTLQYVKYPTKDMYDFVRDRNPNLFKSIKQAIEIII